MKISLVYGTDVAVLPGKAAQYIDKASKKDIKVLFALSSVCGRACSSPEELTAAVAEKCGLDEASVGISIAFWRGTGLLEASPEDGGNEESLPAPTTEKAIPNSTVPVASEIDSKSEKKLLPEDELPNYTTAELNGILNDRLEAAQLIDECQALMGKMFNPHEVSIVLGLLDYLKLDSEYIIILFDYCSRIGKKSLHYIRKLAFSLYDEGITETEELRLHLKKLEAAAEVESEIRKLFGMKSRALTTREKKFITSWVSVFGYGTDMIRKAYEITVDSTHEASLAYANAILERWNSEGIRTPEQVDEAKKEKVPAGNGSFDTDRFFEAALQRSFSSGQKEESEK